MMNYLTKIFGSKHDRDVKKARPIVEEINAIYRTLESLSDDAYRRPAGLSQNAQVRGCERGGTGFRREAKTGFSR